MFWNNSAAPASEEPSRPEYASAFSVVYVEEAAMEHPRTKAILSRLPRAEVIPCRNYREIFARPRQAPTRQKQSQALILAVSADAAIYDGAPVCQDFGNRHFYYTSCVMNCIFDCEYCYLQGMYPCGHIVVFVNLEDTFAALDAVLAKHEAYVCISYDTDLLALEPLLATTADWMHFAASRPGLTLELRTKCAAVPMLRALPALDNVILALTLSPESVIRAYEHHTPSLAARLAFASEALALGWPVRLCFDPMLAVPDAESVYCASDVANPRRKRRGLPHLRRIPSSDAPQASLRRHLLSVCPDGQCLRLPGGNRKPASYHRARIPPAVFSGRPPVLLERFGGIRNRALTSFSDKGVSHDGIFEQ